eukprot:1158746-Pelagomonas_calceolata.AAC.9
MLVFCEVPYLLRYLCCEEGERRRIWRLCCADLLSLPVSVNQACSPRAFAKSFDDHSSSNVMVLNFHAGDDRVPMWYYRMVRFIGEVIQGIFLPSLQHPARLDCSLNASVTHPKDPGRPLHLFPHETRHYQPLPSAE